MTILELEPTTETREQFRSLVDWLEALGRPSPRMVREVGAAIRRGFDRNFQAEGSALGRWNPLARYTQIDRQRQGYNPRHPILQRTGNYRRSWVNALDQDHITRIMLSPNAWTLEDGADSDLALWHEEGTVNMPARPVTYLTRRSERDIRDTLDREFWLLSPR